MSSKKQTLYCRFEGGELNDEAISAWSDIFANGDYHWFQGLTLEAFFVNRFQMFLKAVVKILWLAIPLLLPLIYFFPKYRGEAILFTSLSIGILLVIMMILEITPLLLSRMKFKRVVVYCTNVPTMGVRFSLKLFMIRLFLPITFLIKISDKNDVVSFSTRDFLKANIIIYLVWLSTPCFIKILSAFFSFLPKPPKESERKNKKIVHTTCSFDWGGTQRQIMNLCSACSPKDIKHIPNEIFPDMNKIWRTDEEKKYSEYKTNGGGNIMSYFCCSSNYAGYQLFQIYKLYRDYLAIKPDVVVGWGHEVCIYTYIAAVFAKVPNIVFCIRTVNPQYYDNPDEKSFRKFHKKAFPHLTKTIVNSNFLRNDHAEWLGVDKTEIEVCHNGMLFEDQKENPENIRKKLGIPEDHLIVINVGRFSPEKGQQILVQAAELLQNNYDSFDNVHWIFCGDGSTRMQISNYAQKRKVKNLHFVGAVKNVKDYLSAADIFVMPSDFEGMPNAMMEAMHAGLPCISTNKSGALDLADDGTEALFVPPRNSEAMAEKLVYLLSNSKERTEMGQRAKDKILQFTTEHMVKRFEEILTTSF